MMLYCYMYYCANYCKPCTMQLLHLVVCAYTCNVAQSITASSDLLKQSEYSLSMLVLNSCCCVPVGLYTSAGNCQNKGKDGHI